MGYDLPILAYHKVDFRRELGITAISPERFGKQIRFLKNEGYKAASPASIFGCEDYPAANPKAKRVLLTFDDGYEGIYRYAYPILREYAYSAIIFLTTGYIGRYNSWDASPGPRFKHLNWAHIREMADNGIHFGSHGVNHAFLTKQSDDAAKYEIEASKRELEDGLGRSVRFFSYPYGDYDDRIIGFVREAGYEAAFSLKPELLKSGYMDKCGLVYALPRIAIYLVDNMWAFKAKVGGAHNGSLTYMQKTKNRLINKCAYAGMLVERFRT